MKAAAFVIALLTLPALAFADSPSAASSGRAASLLGDTSLEASYQPSMAPALRLIDGLRFASSGSLPLDTGGGIDAEARQILALVLGLFIGFGLGHLVARDRDGFVLFLIIDVAIVVISSFVGVFAHFYFGYLALAISHVIQGLDAYAEAGGPRIVERARERALEIATVRNREEPAITTRAFSFSF